jgi:hypothetical protein
MLFLAILCKKIIKKSSVAQDDTPTIVKMIEIEYE